MSKSTIAAVGLGTNLGDRLDNLLRARRGLEALPGCHDFCFSPIYETAPVDCPEPLPFLNAAVCFETRLAPHTLLGELLDLEDEAGRTRPYANAPRPLDLDLLIHGQSQVAEDDLRVPHPRLAQRLFVLAPLADCLGTDHPVPGTGATLGRLLARRRELEGAGSVVRIRHPQWATGTR